jgi:hypothetical protein
MTTTEKDVEQIATEIGKRFRTFGGGRDAWPSNNPLVHALKNEPLQFAAGVPVADVVSFVLASKTDAQTDADERERKLSEQLHRTSNALMKWGTYDVGNVSQRALVDEAQKIRTLLSTLDLLGKVGA